MSFKNSRAEHTLNTQWVLMELNRIPSNRVISKYADKPASYLEMLKWGCKQTLEKYLRSIWEISIHFLEAPRKSCLKNCMSKQNTTTYSKKQDKSVEWKTRKIQRTGPGMGTPLCEIVLKRATICALKFLSLENRDCLLTSLWGCENILVLYCKWFHCLSS